MAGKLKNYNSSFGVNKYPGIFFNNLASGDVVFYMRVTLEGKKANVKIGSKSEGVNITYAYNKKKEFDVKQRNGELPDSITKKITAKNNKSSLKFDEIADAFFSYKLEKEPDNAVNIKEQRRDYEIYHKDKLGGLATTQITPEMINEHHKDISQIVSPKTKRKLSQSRINAIMGIVRTIFNHTINNDLINHISPYKIELKNPEFKAQYDALEDEYKAIEALIDARNEAGLTQSEVAKRMGITQSAVARIESGAYNIKYKTFFNYIKACGKRVAIL